MAARPSMIVHGGAGSGKFPRTDRRFRDLGNALDEGLAATRKGSSLDGVERAVSYLEEAGVFNAGKGACLTVDGRMQLDAAVMRGDTLKGAGVGVVTCTYHAVSLARWLMEHTRHLLVAGEECRTYARAAGMKALRLDPSEAARERYGILRKEAVGVGRENARLWRRMERGNTVGAVALDSEGVPSAAVSTGGMWLKLPGRIGDSAIIGAGIYADSRVGAACATGTGEEIIRNALSLKTCEILEDADAMTAARRAIAMMSRRSGRGSAGIVTVDLRGRVGWSYNTEAMGRAWYDHSKGRAVVSI